jgi:hypothetical protein
MEYDRRGAFCKNWIVPLINCLLLFFGISFSLKLLKADEIKIPVISETQIVLDPSKPKDKEILKKLYGERQIALLPREGGGAKGISVTVKSVDEANAGTVAILVKEMRDKICVSLSKGDEVKFSISWDASAKVFGIGLDGKSGIEVKIRCG